MKTSLFSVLSLICVFTMSAFTTTKTVKDTTGILEIAVEYERQAGRGSNQYAVWIEDTEGRLIKTLYVTRFTAEGGYEMRPDCTPTWVKKANASLLSKTEIDAFSGATPQSGKHIYTWNGTDSEGRKMKPGKYTFVVEATYLGKNIVIFEGDFNINDKKQQINPVLFFNSEEQQNRMMIREVVANYNP